MPLDYKSSSHEPSGFYRGQTKDNEDTTTIALKSLQVALISVIPQPRNMILLLTISPWEISVPEPFTGIFLRQSLLSHKAFYRLKDQFIQLSCVS